jgi:RNA polymerase sigma-70 factor (ECF subfamily)
MLLHDSRRDARMRDGEPVLSRSGPHALGSGADRRRAGLVRQALSSNRFGPYTIQAAIAAVHAESPSPDATDWRQIAGLYDVLYRAMPTPVIELNRAAAVAMAFGYERGLALIDALLARGELTGYQHAHAARADLLRRLGRREEARQAYEHTLSLTSQEPERRYLIRRIVELG